MAALVCGAERGAGISRSIIPVHVPCQAATGFGQCWTAPHLKGVVFLWEIRGKHPRLPCLFPDACVPFTGSFSTQPFPAGSAHTVPVLKLSHTEEEEGVSSLCF